MISRIVSGVAASSIALLLFVLPLDAAVMVISAGVNSTAQNGFGGFHSMSTPGVIAPPAGTTTATISTVVSTTMHTFTQSPSPTSLTGDMTLDTGTVVGGVARSTGTLNFSVDVNTPYAIEGMFHYTAPSVHGGQVNVYLRPLGGGTPLFEQLFGASAQPDMFQLSGAALTGTLAPGSYEFFWTVSASNATTQQATHANANVSFTVGVPEPGGLGLLLSGIPLAVCRRRL
jgi:hypothetical protein